MHDECSYFRAMVRLFALFFALLLTGVSPAIADELPSEDIAALEQALLRGQVLYDYDQAAWHTTDAMLKDVKDIASSGIRGWVVEPEDDGWRVTFWKPDGDSFAGVYSALWSKQRVRERKRLTGEAARLTAAQLSLIAARNAVDDSALVQCVDAPFNAVVIPENGGAVILVYLLTPQTSTSSIPFGGHYRFTVRDGTVAEQRSFTKTCLEMPLVDPQGRGEPAALGMSHLLDPVPTEVHIFSMLAAKKPIYVTTTSNQRTWVTEVSGGQARVRLVERK